MKGMAVPIIHRPSDWLPVEDLKFFVELEEGKILHGVATEVRSNGPFCVGLVNKEACQALGLGEKATYPVIHRATGMTAAGWYHRITAEMHADTLANMADFTNCDLRSPPPEVCNNPALAYAILQVPEVIAHLHECGEIDMETGVPHGVSKH